MKVAIHVKFVFTNKDIEIEYIGQSKVIEWDLPLPAKGDCIDIDDFEGKFGSLEYCDRESKVAIRGNIFPYLDKHILFSADHTYDLYFGDWNK